MGGPRIRRWDGVKQAINAIVNDTTLTTGAHFGFGHWNAGESGGGKNSSRGGAFCHRNDVCTYYGESSTSRRIFSSAAFTSIPMTKSKMSSCS
jgi:hypothetical protein